MRTYPELIEVMTQQQRIKRSIASKKTAKISARKRAITAKKPPTKKKIDQAIERQVRKKAIGIVDKSHVYHSAAISTKANIEKKASVLLKKKRSMWTKKLRPEISQKMKDDYKHRMGIHKTKTPGQAKARGFEDAADSGDSGDE